MNVGVARRQGEELEADIEGRVGATGGPMDRDRGQHEVAGRLGVAAVDEREGLAHEDVGIGRRADDRRGWRRRQVDRGPRDRDARQVGLELDEDLGAEAREVMTGRLPEQGRKRVDRLPDGLWGGLWDRDLVRGRLGGLGDPGRGDDRLRLLFQDDPGLRRRGGRLRRGRRRGGFGCDGIVVEVHEQRGRLFGRGRRDCRGRHPGRGGRWCGLRLGRSGRSGGRARSRAGGRFVLGLLEAVHEGPARRRRRELDGSPSGDERIGASAVRVEGLGKMLEVGRRARQPSQVLEHRRAGPEGRLIIRRDREGLIEGGDRLRSAPGPMQDRRTARVGSGTIRRQACSLAIGLQGVVELASAGRDVATPKGVLVLLEQRPGHGRERTFRNRGPRGPESRGTTALCTGVPCGRA